MEIIWSPKARKRVREIFDYYKTRSYEVATKLIEDIDREVNLSLIHISEPTRPY